MAYSQSQGIPYDQQPPAYQASQGVPAYNPQYTQSQGIPHNPGYYPPQPQPYGPPPPQPVHHHTTTYVTQPAGGGTDVSIHLMEQ